MHGIDECNHVIDWSLGKDSVSEVENVTGAAGGLIENRASARSDFANVGEQRDWIEVALHRDIMMEPRPRVGEIDAPIQPDHVAACFAHQLEQVSGHGAEVNNRHIRGYRRNYRGRMRQHKTPVVVAAETADPPIHNLPSAAPA